MPPNRPFTGVYFILCPSNGLVKIGFTAYHPDRRLETLRAASPVPLEPLGVIPGPMSLEGVIHRRFARQRRHGEWFAPSRLLSDLIAYGIDPWPSAPAETDRRPWVPPRVVELRTSLEREAGSRDFPEAPWRSRARAGRFVSPVDHLARFRRRKPEG